jgi:hypothetical protein
MEPDDWKTAPTARGSELEGSRFEARLRESEADSLLLMPSRTKKKGRRWISDPKVGHTSFQGERREREETIASSPRWCAELACVTQLKAELACAKRNHAALEALDRASAMVGGITALANLTAQPWLFMGASKDDSMVIRSPRHPGHA